MVKVITTNIFVKMEMAQGYWEENSNIQPIKYDGNLNFSTATCSEDDCEYGPFRKNKMPRVSSESIRMIKSWRRLSTRCRKLLQRPARSGASCCTGRTVKRQRSMPNALSTQMSYLHLRLRAQDPMSHRIIEKRRRDRMNNCLADLSRLIPTEYLKKGRGRIEKTEIIEMAIKHMKYLQQEQVEHTEYYRSGYQECMSEAVKFMTEIEGHFSRESLCIKLLNHLQKHCDQIAKLQPMAHPASLISEKLLNLNNANNQHQSFTKASHNDEISRCANSNDAFHCNMTKIMDSECSSDTPPIEYVNAKTETIYEKPPVDVNGVSYKYKTDIKHRFIQEKIVHNRRNSVTSMDESPCQNSSGSSECRVSDCEAASHRVPSDTTSNSSDRCMSTGKRKAEVEDNFSVPIFVLHSKGSYYVPSSVDYKTLLPYLKNFNILDLPPTENLVLHPVNINVSYLQHFNGQQNGASKQYKWSQNVL